MATRGKSPGQRAEIGGWHHDKCPAGDIRSGWIAGDIHGIHCHPSRATRPCLCLLLGESAVCQPCRDGKPSTWLGFVPLWRHDGKPTFVVIYEHQESFVSALKLHTYVTWGRLKGAGESISVAPAPINRRWESTIAAKMRPADLSRALAIVWGMPDLERALRLHFGSSDTAVSPPPGGPPPGGPPPTVERSESALMNRLNKKREEMAAGKTGAALIRDLLPVLSENGKHSRK